MNRDSAGFFMVIARIGSLRPPLFPGSYSYPSETNTFNLAVRCTMTPIDTYAEVLGEIQSLYRSRLQIQTLLSLLEKKRTLSELREITGSTSQALIPKIRRLESANYIGIRDYQYHLTPIGRILAGKIRDLILFQAVITRHKQFWADHYPGGIPEPFLSRIGMLSEADIVSDTGKDVFNVFLNFLKSIKEAEKIRILSPISSPAHMDAVVKRVEEGIPVELVVGRELAVKFTQSPYVEMVQALAGKAGSSIRVADTPLKIGLCMTDKCILLGLYRNDMTTYDNTSCLSGTDENAIAWGEQVFEHYRGISTELTF